MSESIEISRNIYVMFSNILVLQTVLTSRDHPFPCPITCNNIIHNKLPIFVNVGINIMPLLVTHILVHLTQSSTIQTWDVHQHRSSM